MSKNRFIISSLLIMMLILSYYLAFKQPLKKTNMAINKITQSIKKDKVNFSDTKLVSIDNKGQKIFSLASENLSLQNDNKVSYKNVAGIFFNKNKESFTFKCDNAIYNLQTKDINLTGNIFLSSKLNQSNLKAKNIFYFKNKNKLFSKQRITFTKEKLNISANSFIADLSLKKIQFIGDTQSEIIF